jgi:hypothetical protein
MKRRRDGRHLNLATGLSHYATVEISLPYEAVICDDTVCG